MGAELSLEGGGCLPLLVENRRATRPVPAHHPDEGGGAEGRGAAAARVACEGRGRPTGSSPCPASRPWAGRPTPIAWPASLAAFGPRPHLPRRAAPPPARAGGGQPGPARPGRRPSACAAVATNGVRHAGRRGRPLLDALTCIREKTDPRHGRAAPDRERRAALEVAQGHGGALRRPPRPPAQHRGAGRAARRFTLDDLGYRFPDYPVPPGETPHSFLCRVTEAGARERYRPYHEKARRQIERELAAHRQARAGRLFPDRLGPRELLPARGDPGPGPRLRRQQRGLLQPRHHRRGPRGHGAALRALPLRGARRVARHRPRPAQRRPARAGDPVRLRALRRARARP